ncbi:hypothetical protein BC939DRAFT_167441 [Gamsiella multidivaricata]|uniref:uncharacterized protein n=1 Tax=Gamsiella multidivaricata TaxID=101098 RepID=UPI00221FB323|nr:uncharacterized protein BC939DRAFT_167441 [Gamsiella multidivaricata]KAI7823235.1 hypothetical protein BC939DRAFT_167441 [Gamsiella multidivaricata]
MQRPSYFANLFGQMKRWKRSFERCSSLAESEVNSIDASSTPWARSFRTLRCWSSLARSNWKAILLNGIEPHVDVRINYVRYLLGLMSLAAQKESTIVVDDTAASMIPVVLGCRPRTPVVQETMERHARKLEGLYLSYGGMSREVMLPSLPECTSASSASSSLLPLLPPSRHSFTSQLSSLTTIDN